MRVPTKVVEMVLRCLGRGRFPQFAVVRSCFAGTWHLVPGPWFLVPVGSFANLGIVVVYRFLFPTDCVLWHVYFTEYSAATSTLLNYHSTTSVLQCSEAELANARKNPDPLDYYRWLARCSSFARLD